jgi:hypothetical protein
MTGANFGSLQPKPAWLIIGRMKAGWHATAEGCSSSGGTLEGYASEAPDGAQVYDGIEAEDGAAGAFVVSGPLLNAALYGVKRFTEHATAARMLPGMSGGYDRLILLALVQKELEPENFGSFDKVDWSTYRGLLEKKVPGVKFGEVRGGVVFWEIELAGAEKMAMTKAPNLRRN